MMRALPLIAASVNDQEQEAKLKSGLPTSFHQLCGDLTGILHSYYLIEQWHMSPFDLRNVDSSFLHRQRVSDDISTHRSSRETPNALDPSSSPEFCPLEAKLLREIRTELVRHRHLLWNHCESLLERLIDEQLIQDSKHKLPSLSLPSLTYLMQIEHSMELIVQDFIGSSIRNSDFDPEAFFRGIRTKMSHVCLRHLHCFHQESVNAVRNMLKDESWHLMSVDTSINTPTFDINYAEKSCATVLTSHGGHVKPDASQSQAGALNVGYFSNFHLKGNVFNHVDICYSSLTTMHSSSYFDKVFQDLHHAVRHATARSEGKSKKHFGGTKTAVNGLTHLSVKYLQLMKALPLIADHVAASLSLLFDLYFVFVLRLW